MIASSLTVFVFVLFAHFIGDIALQSPWQAENKGKLWYVMLSHCMIWAGTVSFVLLYFDAFQLWMAPFLVLGHWAMDRWKSRIPKTPENWKYIYPDQAWHIIQCAIVSFVSLGGF